MKKELGDDCKGICSYFVGIVRDSSEVPRFIPFIHPALESVYRKVPLIHDWEQQMIAHTHTLAIHRDVTASAT